MQMHLVLRHFTTDHQARFADLRKTLDNLIHLPRVHKHAAHLGGLIGAAHPAFDALVGTTCRTHTRQYGCQVAGTETYQRVIRVQRGHHQFAHFALGHRVAGAGPHDFHNHAFIQHQAFACSSFVRDQTNIGCGVTLVGGDAAFGQPVAQ